jgi:ribosomal protein L11 methylase PrmA
MLKFKELNFPLSDNREIALTSAPGVFSPTGTTKLLIEAVKQKIVDPASLLDLGCGTGVVGLALHLQGIVKSPLCASDLSEPAVICSEINFKRYECPFDVRQGSLFEPWLDHKFDVIVDDISGISREVADLSSWFQGVPCESGEDGTSLVVDIIREASKYLTGNGRFFFPVISLSNVDVLLDTAKNSFDTVEMVSRQEWPLPDELKQHMPLLERLNDEGIIKLEKRFGLVLWYTEIYCAYNI